MTRIADTGPKAALWPLALAAVFLAFGWGCTPPQRQAEGPSSIKATAREAAPPPATGAVRPAERTEGGAAVLTPEGSAANVRSPVRARCIVSIRGALHRCELPRELPPSQQHAIWLALESWRFSPMRHDGRPFATELYVDVPLTPPPPGWALPGESPLRLRAAVLPPSQPWPPLGGLDDMVPPRLVSGAVAPAYPREALERGLEGKVIAQCIISEEGALEDCDIIQSVPFLDDAVLASLRSRRYTPVLFKGQPQRVFYTFPFTFSLPRYN